MVPDTVIAKKLNSDNMWRPYRSNANQAHLKRALL